jgi:hypothetical protein
VRQPPTGSAPGHSDSTNRANSSGTADGSVRRHLAISQSPPYGSNLCPDTIDQAHTAAETGLNRVGSDYDLCGAFPAHTGLSYDLNLPNYRNIFNRRSPFALATACPASALSAARMPWRPRGRPPP